MGNGLSWLSSGNRRGNDHNNDAAPVGQHPLHIPPSWSSWKPQLIGLMEGYKTYKQQDLQASPIDSCSADKGSIVQTQAAAASVATTPLASDGSAEGGRGRRLSNDAMLERISLPSQRRRPSAKRFVESAEAREAVRHCRIHSLDTKLMGGVVTVDDYAALLLETAAMTAGVDEKSAALLEGSIFADEYTDGLLAAV